jgi:hypothetical protein
MRAATSALGSESDLTLVDKLHIVGLLVILFAAAIAVISRFQLERGERTSGDVKRLNYWATALSAAAFAATNVVLILLAVGGG